MTSKTKTKSLGMYSKEQLIELVGEADAAELVKFEERRVARNRQVQLNAYMKDIQQNEENPDNARYKVLMEPVNDFLDALENQKRTELGLQLLGASEEVEEGAEEEEDEG